jgi:MtN3 and saliva related transmembrane protein
MDWNIFFKVVGYVAAVGTTISFLPQAIKSIKTHDTKNISLLMYIFFVTGTACWLAYGIYRRDYPVIVANAITLVLASIILVLKIINLPKEKAEKAEAVNTPSQSEKTK